MICICLFSSHSLAKESNSVKLLSFVPGRNLEKYELLTWNLDQVLTCIGTLRLQFEFLISDNRSSGLEGLFNFHVQEEDVL